MNYKKQENDVLFLDRCPKRSDEVVKDLTEAKEQGRLEEALLEIFSKYEMDMLIIWKCREFFRSCPDDFYRKNMHVLSYRTLIEAMAGNVEEAKRYESFLDAFPEELQEYTLTAMNLVKMMIKMVMPYYDNEEFFRTTSFVALAVTACRPSVINGFRDVTEICPQMENNTEKIIDAIYKTYGNSGKGVYEVALAEWKYEIGDTFNINVLDKVLTYQVDQIKIVKPDDETAKLWMDCGISKDKIAYFINFPFSGTIFSKTIDANFPQLLNAYSPIF